MKTRVQTTVGLSELNLQEDQFLRRSLSTIVQMSQEDKTAHSNFPNLVKEAAEKLFLILRDSVTINQHKDDPEMLADMHYRIAKGYMNAPDLRLPNLETLLKMQFANKNWAEAGYGVLHCAALVCQCLKTMSKKNKNIDMSCLPDGAKGFAFISSNLLLEEASSVEGEGTGESPSFSEKGLVTLLEQSTNFLRKAQLFETINDVYKLLIPIYEKNRNFEQLSNIHFQLHKDFNNVTQMNTNGKRILATYYRVAFFGSLFKELDGKEFVYKERSVTPLAEISNRLEDMYSQKFGAESFEIIRDSDKIVRSDLKPNKAYVQITYCEPYFDEEESKKRITYFERNNNLKFFVFETPYTKGGKAHGNVDEQYKRKTIIETERTFPDLTKRLLIVGQREIDQSPIEVSIEAIQNRNTQIRAAVEANPPDAKNLQVLLQGSVRLQVNSGPLEIVNSFLSPEKQKNYQEENIKLLKSLFKDFLHCCDQALLLNKTLIKQDQVKYQEDLQEGFEELKKKVWPLVSDGSSDVFKSVVDERRVHALSFIAGFDDD